VDYRTLAWDKGGNYNEYEGLDLDPENMCNPGLTVSDPLERIA